MSSAVERALEELRGFVERNRGRYPVTDAFPSQALWRIQYPDAPVPPEATPLVTELLEMTHRYDDAVDHWGRNSYEGADLRRDCQVVQALESCPPDPALVPTLTAMLGSATVERYYAQPGGTPDIDKYDRDSSVESAQDQLACACAALLGKLPLDAAAREALEAATRHRSDEARSAASAALRARR